MGPLLKWAMKVGTWIGKTTWKGRVATLGCGMLLLVILNIISSHAMQNQMNFHMNSWGQTENVDYSFLDSEWFGFALVGLYFVLIVIFTEESDCNEYVPFALLLVGFFLLLYAATSYGSQIGITESHVRMMRDFPFRDLYGYRSHTIMTVVTGFIGVLLNLAALGHLKFQVGMARNNGNPK